MELIGTVTGTVTPLPAPRTVPAVALVEEPVAGPGPGSAPLTTGPDTLAALTAGYDIIRQPLGQILPRLSLTLAELIPHEAAAELSTHCAFSPFKAYGEAELTDRISTAELDPLFTATAAGQPWQGRAQIAGAERSVITFMTDATPRGALLVLVRADGVAPAGEPELAVAQQLWSLVTSHFDRLSAEAAPGALARSRAAADTRSRVIAELTATHAATLTGLLGVLRSRSLDDAAARATATELAVSALVELRAEADRDKAVAEERVDEAFARLADTLRPLLRYSHVRLELGAPDSTRHVAADVAHTARLIVREVLLAVLDQEPVSRVHVGWQVDEHELRASVRDDGPGALDHCTLGRARIGDRLEVLGGRLDIDAVPGWGTTVTAIVPLSAADAPTAKTAPDPLGALGGRELEVLTHLAMGHRNRVIAQELHISESTVKFHVAKILTKLGVASRGEAAALFHAVA
ncbi:helix-turn-helix transcriptional regulator [Streptomyces purpureus]|uniref:Helix-turn-helix transcriptional regulator n=1 Tax=Streptomyces purpureus TaxID=1951 RepID=A0A918LRG1_9ACTN|nr:LuxR C-terminal-related transcriptional regulator [Streptomyces purpureus]GGT38173.1 helix-turn-helix transcriptional regulator [Streptomyces purpureus]